MSDDFSEFLDVFFEECAEGLDVMESGLLALDGGTPDGEAINTIFRAAHSIKGGAATFDFPRLADFTHTVEALLDRMRDGRRAVTRDAVDLLLAAVDALRGMVAASRAGEPLDEARAADLKRDLEAAMDAPAASAAGETAAPTPAVQDGAEPATGWRIRFVPAEEMLARGNDPLHILRALEELGRLEVRTDGAGLPALDALDTTRCHLGFDLTLHGTVSEVQVREVFAWVDGECELHVAPLDPAAASPPAAVGRDEPESHAAHDPTTDPEAPVDTTATAEPPAAVPSAAPPALVPAPAPTGGGEAGSIRVGIEKVDGLINLVGELVITQSMLSSIAEGANGVDLEKLRDGVAQLVRNTRELQEMAMQIRMLPIATSFNRFPRLVRDLGARLGKQVELRIEGGGTELDKTVLEKIGDPLVHLVRNSMDHGIERPEQRRAAGKPDIGVLTLAARHEGGNIVIEVGDDGAGLDTARILAKARERGLVGVDEDLTEAQVQDLVFRAGFSTAEQVSDVSGRGVGMDVVRRNIQELGGAVTVTSAAGTGSTFTIRLPLTLAILDGQLVRVGAQIYILSLLSVVESVQVKPGLVSRVAGHTEVFALRGRYIPVVRLHRLFGIDADSARLEDGLLVVVEAAGRRVALFIDELLGQQQVVIKSLESNYRHVQGLSGATILGDGRVALILDVPRLIQRELAAGRGAALAAVDPAA